jgi:hypothetical protein
MGVLQGAIGGGYSFLLLASEWVQLVLALALLYL